MRSFSMGILSLLLVLGAGCGDSSEATSDSTVPQVDSGPTGDPSASFKSLQQYAVAKAAFKVETETSAVVSKVELLVDGNVVAEATASPFTIEWDTTGTADGVVQLALKAHAGAQSATGDPLPVVVLNNGEEVSFDEGAEQTMTIDPAVDSHVKVHWTMPSAVKKVIGVLFWDNTEFKMQLDLGTGNCPHSGQSACNATSDTSPVMAQYPETAVSGTLGEGMWFSHAGPTNDADLVGKTAKLTFKAFLLK